MYKDQNGNIHTEEDLYNAMADDPEYITQDCPSDSLINQFLEENEWEEI